MNHPYRYLFHKTVLWVRHSFHFLWLIGVAGYLMVLAGNAVYRNYLSQAEMTALRDRLSSLQLEKERLEALIVYYKTDSFKEKELRRTLLLKKPNEKVYALPESSVARRVEDELAASVSAAAEKKKASSGPIWQQWLRYVWSGEKQA
jgi:cell division protein FtsB